jgi:hypothetical protein
MRFRTQIEQLRILRNGCALFNQIGSHCEAGLVLWTGIVASLKCECASSLASYYINCAILP